MKFNFAKTLQYLQFLLMIIQIDTRITRRHHHHKRNIADGCLSTANSQMHEAFVKLIDRKDEKMFSFFQPETQILLEHQPSDGHILVSENRGCDFSSQSSREILPDHPLIKKSVCPYTHVINYNPKRIPETITEVKCECGMMNVHGSQFECVEMRYNMRVMEFIEGCDKYVEKVINVSLACVPTYTNQINSGTLSFKLEKPTAMT